MESLDYGCTFVMSKGGNAHDTTYNSTPIKDSEELFNDIFQAQTALISDDIT
ncbi:hypothetical protein SAMN05444359_1366 [Neolewinella agarilytica]|uniref:Uncharacterized protein n=1 Tax=Neolewinella agarilytica TaxID=478744 RepID=A0A1H9ND52_9BACT|nr:hypothetical protein SAMN05444359_1366 [Neolewinella agarilytica]